MQRAAAAKGHQNKVAGIVASLDRDYANRPFHVGLDHTENADCKFLDALNWALSFPHNPLGPFTVELHSTTQEALRIEPPKHQVGVSNRRQVPAAETDRPWLRACRLGPDAQHAAGIEAGDRST